MVVGANLAGLRAVETLRQKGYDGRLTLVGDEPMLPYDRPPLSKEVLTGVREPDSTLFRTAEELAALDVELVLGVPATHLDLDEQLVEVGDALLPFDGLILATGAAPRRLAELEGRSNVLLLRTLEDSRRLREQLIAGPRVVVVGAGVIGCEVAASARSLGLEVTIVETATTVMLRSVGPEMGAVCADLHREHGTDIRCGVGVSAVEGREKADRLHLTDGTVVEPDVVVVGVGVEPNTSWLAGSGLELSNGIVCDETLNAGHAAIYAAGDVASWPNALLGARMRCEQWTNAAEQGRHAARNLLAGDSAAAPFVGANYFWSDQYGARIQFVGSSEADEILVLNGHADTRLACYRRGNFLAGVFGIDLPHAVMKGKVMVEGRRPWDEALRELSC